MVHGRSLGVFLLLVACGHGVGEGATAVVAPETSDAPEQLEALIINDHQVTEVVAEGCPFDGGAPVPSALFDDSSLPEFDKRRARRSNYLAGEEHLNDVQLYDQMLPLQGEIFRCLEIAECYNDTEISAVDFEFDFELGPDGRVKAATVTPSAAAKKAPLVPCARLALASLEFTSFDGGSMFVNYQLSIE